ncbi:lysozyme 1B-like [Saccostrea cucullata]|uniref:lysozyme 1B-like n=1 Tax=Saccostrea cuccullata TaxID=36930 RepID=UPI002ED4D987
MAERTFLFICGMILTVSCKTFTKCGLAKELARLGTLESDIDDYVCMAEHESGFRTDIIGRENPDKFRSRDHGIFQINDHWNCDPQNGKTTRNGCHSYCSNFRNADISDDLTCVQQLKRENRGFKFSKAWEKHCQQIPSDYLRECQHKEL